LYVHNGIVLDAFGIILLYSGQKIWQWKNDVW